MNIVSEFTVFGSCTCRDIFNSTINNNYKEYFHINTPGIRLSYISLMQNPIEFDEESIKLFPETKENINFSNWIKRDLDKSFLNDLKKNKSDYIIIDTYYDVNFGIIDLGNNNYITNNMHLEDTEFYKSLDFKELMTIQSNTDEYFNLWVESCNSFFEYLNKYCKNINVILNPTRHVTRLIKENGNVIDVNLYKKMSERYNPYRDLLDGYIIENFDIDVLYFDDNTLASEKSIWGPSSLHYDAPYFTDVTKQLNDIIKRNDILESLDEYNLIYKFKQQSRNLLLFKIQSNNSANRTMRLIQKNKQNKSYRTIVNLYKTINENLLELNKNIDLDIEEYEFLKGLNDYYLSQINNLNKKEKSNFISKINPF